MGKQSVKDKSKVLFYNTRNSNTTINTLTKTYSGISQSCTKSLIMQLKKKLPENTYYEDNGILKRDLSIETDVCILRRYYKQNKNKIQNKPTSSARSKYSINNTEVNTATDLRADTSACGDSEPKTENTQLNVDLTTLVVDNLKTLLNEWIRNYLLENDETKQKIETVLDSILHKVELEHSSSSCTYNLDIKVKRDAFNDNATVTTISDRNKISSLTVPLTGNQLKLISTLSVPKKISPKRKKKITRFLQDNDKKSSKLNLKSSHYNVLEITTESFTKRFATYQNNENINQIFEYKTLNFKPQSSQTTISSERCLKKKDIDINEEYLKRSLRYGDYENRDNKFKDKIDNSIYHRESKISSNYFIKDKNNPLIATHLTKYKSSEINTPTFRIPRKDSKRRRNARARRKLLNKPTVKKIKTKRFAFYYRKSTNRVTQQKAFIKHVKKIYNYFEKCEHVSNLKINIQVNVFPKPSTENDFSSVISQEEISKYDEETKILFNVKSKRSNAGTSQINVECNKTNVHYSNEHVKIISLLDGAVSHTKYIASNPTNECVGLDDTKENKNIDTSGFEIVQDIGEIKNIIKDLSSLAKSIVKEHLSEKYQVESGIIKLNTKASKLNESHNIKTIEKEESSKESKGIQCSTYETNDDSSGLKLKKGPKNKESGNEELNARLTRKSTSYRIIESESILKVHDMTSAAQVDEEITDQFTDKALTCSLPKSKSLFEISTGANNQNLVAFYCDECFKPTKCMYEAGTHNIPFTSQMCSFCPHPGHMSTVKYCSRECLDDELNSPLLIQCSNKNCKNMQRTESDCDNDCDDINSCSTVCIEIEDNPCDKKFIVRKRSVSFTEGCVYCTVLWIPVLIISWFFYVYTLKDFIASKQKTARFSSVTTSSTPFPISLVDLGF
ncbi:uncharacterized protein LOC123703664 [Colias croceus]|uniref:uncharacterized protein LOC123703664 n=1 Tax=Colias crocea TaxID=72248 RepID=UPI001E27AA82|nr:uncharacterized protein LOC123703664 [Colias croceus]